MLFALLLTLSLAADKPAKAPAKKSSTMSKVIRDVSATAAMATSDAGSEQIVNGIDVSKLPFTPDSIKQVVLSYQPQVQGCHEEAMVSAKPITGTIKVAFTITADGMVKSAKVDKKASGIKDPHLGDCLVAVVSSMRFPMPPDGKDHPIEFPFNLKPVE